MVDLSLLRNFDYVMSGYVLTPGILLEAVVQRINHKEIFSIDIALETNQNFAHIEDGWRSFAARPGEMLLKEFGSHCVNLATELTEENDFTSLNLAIINYTLKMIEPPKFQSIF